MAVLLGRTSASTSTDFTTANRTAVWKFTAVLTGSLVVIKAQTKVANATAGGIRLGIYDDTAGVPINLLAVANVDSLAAAQGTGVFQATLVTPVSIVSGTVYWLGWFVDATETMDFQGDTSGSYNESPAATNFVNPWTTGGGGGVINAIVWGESADASTNPDNPPLFHDLAGPGTDFGPNPFAEDPGQPIVASSGAIQTITPATVNMSFTETAAVVATKVLTAADTIRFTETAALVATKKVAPSGTTITFAETAALVATKVVAASSNITFAETASLVASKVLAASSALSFSESATVVATKILGATVNTSFATSASLTKISAAAVARFIRGFNILIFRLLNKENDL